ncbi:MAG: lycopene cyclase domain-containing protein [Frankiaceae bacterium]
MRPARLRKAAYLGVLAGCAATTLPLEVVLGARAYRRPGRLLATVAPVAAAFAAWDVAAIRAGWWRYDPELTTGVALPGDLPIEEALFFLVVPVCAVLTLEAVRVRRPAWVIGDE